MLRNRTIPSSLAGLLTVIGCAIAESDPQAAGHDGLRLEVTGPTGNVHIKSFLDGVQVHDCTTISGTLASGQAGVSTYGSNTVAEFDGFKVSTP